MEFQTQLTRQNERLIKQEKNLVKRWDAVHQLKATLAKQEAELDADRARLIYMKRQLDEKRRKLNKSERRTERWARKGLGMESIVRDWDYGSGGWDSEGSESPPRGRRMDRS